MFPAFKEHIRISEFNRGGTLNHGKNRQYLVELEHLNFVVSFAVKNLLESIIRYQQTGQSPVETYFELSGQQMSADDIVRLITEHLPDEIFLETNIQPPKKPFAISMTVLNQQWLSCITPWFRWLFNPLPGLLLVSLFVLIHLTLMPDIVASVQGSWAAENTLIFVAFMLFSYLTHEIGHISACSRFNCQHGDIGFGLYFIFPVFFADVSKAWSLTAPQRVIIDLGGLYFQSILLIAVDLYAYLTGNSLAYIISWTVTFTMLHTLNPFFKFDGYWLLSDLSGITNLHEKMRLTLRQLLGGLIRGKRPVITDKKQLYLLLPYSLFTLMFIGYVSHFLINQIVGYANKLPAELTQWFGHFVTQVVSTTDAFYGMVQLLALIIWPLLIVIISGVYAVKVASILIGAIKYYKNDSFQEEK